MAFFALTPVESRRQIEKKIRIEISRRSGDSFLLPRQQDTKISIKPIFYWLFCYLLFWNKNPKINYVPLDSRIFIYNNLL
jgi:hypothetical protein